VSRRALAGAIVLAAVLRGLPLAAPLLGVELEEAYPRHAILGVVAGDWKPFALVHGSVLSDVLHASYALWYGAGFVLGAYAERIDMLAAFLRTPLPFLVLARVVMLLASLVGVGVTARLAVRLAGRRAGPAAAVILATSFIHVRESLHVWPDALAATAAVATVLLALVHRDRGTRGTAIALGAAGGLALACKHAALPLALPIGLALWTGGGTTTARVRRVLGASMAALAAYLVVSPHSVLDWPELALQLRIQSLGTFGAVAAAARLSWGDLMRITLGTGPLVLAAVGVVTSARRAPAPTAIAAAFPMAYLALLARANPFARYFAIAAPFVAVFGGAGAAMVAERVAPRRPGLVVLVLVAGASAVPAGRSWQYVRLLGRPDTRVLAGRWLERHVPPGTTVTLPNLVGYANPRLAPDAFILRLEYPTLHQALAARGLGDPARTFRFRYQGMLSNYDAGFVPHDPVVVTAAHPSSVSALSTPAVNETRLRAAGYTVAVRFEGVPEPPPAGLVYDPQEADYAPLVGAGRVPRLGPTLTIWRAP